MLVFFMLLYGAFIYAQRDSSNIINYYALSTDKVIPTNAEAIRAGKNLFALHCTECHAFCRQEIGPALASVTERRPLLWLLTFIRNPRNVINSGDPYANYLFQQYDNKLMPEFEQLSEQEILNILGYIQAESENEYDLSSGPPVEAEKVKPQYGEEYATEYYRNDSAIGLVVDRERVTHGKKLYQLHCESCHNFCKKKLGPALASVTDRRPLPWLISFVKNPQEMLDKRDSYAQFLHSSYDLVMPSFSFLEEDEIVDILAYIQYETGSPARISGTPGNQDDLQEDDLEISYEDQKAQEGAEDFRREPQWGTRVAYVVIVAITISLLIFIMRKFWRKL